MSANPLRGEVSLVLGEARHVLRPTFAALVAAEEELGSLFALVERAGSGTLRLAEMVALFWHCLERRDETLREPFAEAVVRTGIAACTPAMRALMVQVLKGGE